mmetsp:Transcript_43146/g.108077  ORF Transcript_43146/g.108077 Transcript_43146/m.108077 type:complete len:321 (-) Transcript_43146:86-1048(-)
MLMPALMSSSSKLYRLSRRDARKLPGPRASPTPCSAASPNTPNAAAVASIGSSGLEARNAAIRPVTEQPVAVMSHSMGTPLFTSMTRWPSVTKSVAPEIATMHWYWRATIFPASRALADDCVLSTPLALPAAPAKAMISDPFPRTTVGLIDRMSTQALVLYAVAPAPTGSRTQGIFVELALVMASFIAATQVLLRVPTLISKPEDIAVNSSTSSQQWTIAGDAPAARRVLAKRSMETKLVMHCTSGRCALTFFQAAQASLALFCVPAAQTNAADRCLERRGRAVVLNRRAVSPRAGSSLARTAGEVSDNIPNCDFSHLRL